MIPEKVAEARQVEMSYFKNMGVYRKIPRAVMRSKGGKTINTRWIDTNKGDEQDPDYRSRLVGKEFNVGVFGVGPSLYAATPPLEALRLVVSQAATWE